jgi:hypothetical protein
MIYEERYKIDYQDTRHHTSLRVTKPNGDTGIIAHFGGDYWYGTGCFEGYSQEYLKAFYRDFTNDYNRVVDEKNKCIKHEHHAKGCLSTVMVLAFFLATLLAVSAISSIAQDLTITQITAIHPSMFPKCCTNVTCGVILCCSSDITVSSLNTF